MLSLPGQGCATPTLHLDSALLSLAIVLSDFATRNAWPSSMLPVAEGGIAIQPQLGGIGSYS